MLAMSVKNKKLLSAEELMEEKETLDVDSNFLFFTLISI